jgi:integrase
MTACAFDTPAKRSRLQPRRNPYWHGIGGGRGGLTLGFRRTSTGNGVWVAKIVLAGRRIEERIGTPDGERAVAAAMSYPLAVEAALAWGRRHASSIAAVAEVATATFPTVRLAVEEYIAVRNARTGRNDSLASLKRHVLGDRRFSEIKLARFTVQAIGDWRAKLPAELAPTTKNRILNDLRAALNAAAIKYRHALPSHIAAEHISSSPRRQLLTNEQVRAIVDAAFEVDTDGDFGRLIMLAAVTGARFSQLAELTVVDVQIENCRLMMPSSRKGKNRRPGARAAVPTSLSVIERLVPAIAGRAYDAPLLMRWAYRQTGGPGKWTKTGRRRWERASEIKIPWSMAIKQAKAPADTIMYALRHSSIVRGLVKNLPLRLVAALHDTSVEMIEKHYAAFIVDVTEGLARQTLIELDEPKMQEAAE